jgi:Cdc6-like AAA superfamily ATPase
VGILDLEVRATKRKQSQLRQAVQVVIHAQEVVAQEQSRKVPLRIVLADIVNMGAINVEKQVRILLLQQKIAAQGIPTLTMEGAISTNTMCQILAVRRAPNPAGL